MENLPISKDILTKRMAIPTMISKLSYVGEKLAIHYLRVWGGRKMQISPLYDELVSQLNQKGLEL